jgi:hypothetical protein
MRTLLAAGLLLVLPLPAPADDLWPRAVEWGSAFQNWLPGTMDMVSEMLDKEGKAVETTEIRFRLSQKPGGELDQELLRYVENGKDATAAKKAEMEKAKAEEEAKEKADGGNRKAEGGDDGEVSVGVEVAGVFHPDLQKGTQVKPGVHRRAVGGRMGLEHAFSQKQKDGTTVEGTAWLDRETGLPLEVDYVPVPLPKHVKSLASVIRYGPGAGENWHAVEMVSEGVGGILFIKKRFRFTMKFGDYFQYTPPTQP